MRATEFGLAAAGLVLVLASPAAAQPGAASPAQPVVETGHEGEPPAEPSEPIVVTGARALVVNVEQVATRCRACLRALARISGLATDRSRGRTPQSLDQGLPSVDLGMRAPADVTTARAGDMMRYTEHQTRARITARNAPQDRPRAEPNALPQDFVQNLLAYVGPIVDRKLRETGAPAAYAADDPATRGLATTDITDFVVMVLDRDHSGVDLLARRR